MVIVYEIVFTNATKCRAKFVLTAQMAGGGVAHFPPKLAAFLQRFTFYEYALFLLY